MNDISSSLELIQQTGYLPKIFQNFSALAVARIDLTGQVLEANLGFTQLMNCEIEGAVGRNISTKFINPSFAEITRSDPAKFELLYQGIMTLGDPYQYSHSVKGVLCRQNNEIFLIAERDIHEMEQLAATVIAQNEELTLLQRKQVKNIHDLQKAKAEITRLMLTDPLTGLPNRRHFEQEVERELQRSIREQNAFCIALGDIDFFKRINDQHGHNLGDRVLCKIAEQISSCIRNADFPARWGGEEFIILLVNTDLHEGMIVTDRLRTEIAHTVHDAIDQTITMSLGISQHVYGETFDDTLKRADTALYQAKANGRNQLCHA